jgi:hypothetical protein
MRRLSGTRESNIFHIQKQLTVRYPALLTGGDQPLRALKVGASENQAISNETVERFHVHGSFSGVQWTGKTSQT